MIFVSYRQLVFIVLQLSLLEWGTFLLLEANYLGVLVVHVCVQDKACTRVVVNAQTFNNCAQNSFDLQIDAFLWFTLYIFALFFLSINSLICIREG